MIVDNHKLAQKIVNLAPSVDEVEVINPVKVGNDKENEMLMFLKPEVFMGGSEEERIRRVQMALDKLGEFEVDINGMVIIGGQVLDQKEIMNQHYGFINQMSRRASELVSDEEKQIIAEKLGLDLDGYVILGGHEIIERFGDLDSLELDKWWFEGQSTKIRSGFYVRPAERKGKKVIMVNAFHPEQLAHFTRPDRRLFLLSVSSNSDWSLLRDELIGATFPEKAPVSSIRGSLYADPKKYGFEKVSIANNAVHLSAGPVEALAEMRNFLGGVLDIDITQEHPNLIRYLKQEGLSIEEILEILENPIVEHEGKIHDLNSHTEHKNTKEAVRIWLNHKKKRE